MQVDLYQAYLGDAQRALVAPEAIPHDVTGNTGADAREYGLFRRVAAARAAAGDTRPWGLVSSKFAHKALLSPGEFMRLAGAQFAAGADCVFLNPMIGNEAIFANVWEQWAMTDHSIIDLCRYLAPHGNFGLAGLMAADSFAFCNYFIANDAFWQRYFGFVDGIVARLDAEAARGTAIGALFTRSAHYPRDPRLTLRSFVIERLFSTLVSATPDLRVVAAGAPLDRYRAKFGPGFGEALHTLSALKIAAVATRDPAAAARWDTLRRPLLDGFGPTIWTLDDPPELLMSPDYRPSLAR